jgi:translation initiation factor 3 subunit A
VIEHLLEVATAKVTEAQAKSENTTMDAIEDLEAYETPESIMMKAIMSGDSTEKSDREIMMPWMKFLWDTYRTVLDILRNNTRLEALYQVHLNTKKEIVRLF